MNSVLTRLSIVEFSLLTAILMFPYASDAKIGLKDVAAMWLFEEAQDDGIGSDASGNGHHGELKNRPKEVDGKFGGALKFNGKDNLAAGASYVEVPHDEALNLPDAISISAWVIRREFDFFVHEARSQTILEKGGSWAPLTNSGYGLALHEVLDNMFFFYFKDGWRGAVTVPDQDWHHYAVVAKRGDANPDLYIDGELQPIVHKGGVARKMEWTPEERPVHIGAQLQLDEFYSSNIIDDVAIFNKALAEDDVKKLSQKGLVRTVLAVSPSGKLATIWAEIKQSR